MHCNQLSTYIHMILYIPDGVVQLYQMGWFNYTRWGGSTIPDGVVQLYQMGWFSYTFHYLLQRRYLFL